jgi:hypothetical protein
MDEVPEPGDYILSSDPFRIYIADAIMNYNETDIFAELLLFNFTQCKWDSNEWPELRQELMRNPISPLISRLPTLSS